PWRWSRGSGRGPGAARGAPARRRSRGPPPAAAPRSSRAHARAKRAPPPPRGRARSRRPARARRSERPPRRAARSRLPRSPAPARAHPTRRPARPGSRRRRPPVSGRPWRCGWPRPGRATGRRDGRRATHRRPRARRPDPQPPRSRPSPMRRTGAGRGGSRRARPARVPAPPAAAPPRGPAAGPRRAPARAPRPGRSAQRAWGPRPLGSEDFAFTARFRARPGRGCTSPGYRPYGSNWVRRRPSGWPECRNLRSSFRALGEFERYLARRTAGLESGAVIGQAPRRSPAPFVAEGNLVVESPISRLEESRGEIAKAWVMRVVERSSLEELQRLPMARIARELPELVAEIARVAGQGEGSGTTPLEWAQQLSELSGHEAPRAQQLVRDLAMLQSAMIAELHRGLDRIDAVSALAMVERLAEIFSSMQADAVEDVLTVRSGELEWLGTTDRLTGLHNTRFMQQHLNHLLGVQKRYGHPFALLLLDIDGLKRINDAYGSSAGDRTLVGVATAVGESIRNVDTPV